MEFFYQKFKKPLFIILLLLLGGGIVTYLNLQKSLFPNITFPKIKIIADNGEQPVDKMMVTVTRPLEAAIKQIPDIKLIRDVTSRGSSEFSAFLKWDADIYRSQQLIESRINQIRNALPPGVQITIERMNPSILPVMGLMLQGEGKDLITLKKIAKFTIKPFLSQLDGVSKIQIQGGKEKEYRVVLNHNKMSRLGINPSKVQSAIASTGFLNSNGFATGYRRMYLTISDAGAHSLDEIENIVISNNRKRVIHLSDVAQVRINRQIQYVKVNTNGREGVLANVIKQPNKNLLDLSSEINRKLPELQKLLPAGVRLEKYYDQADFVGKSIRSVIDAIWIGLVFAIIITILFLRSFRSSITILIVIPTTLALSLVVIKLVGYTLNLMTLGAIAAGIGLIIDDAIVVIEQMHRLWEEYPNEDTLFHIHQAIKYLLPALVGSSLSTIVIFFPFSLMSGVAGAYFKVLADTMIIILGSSFLVVWILLPVVYILFSGKRSSDSPTEHKTNVSAWSRFFISHPSITFGILLFLIGGTYWAIPRLRSGFLPQMDEGTIILDYNSPPGTSLTETNRMLSKVDTLISQNPEVANYSRRTGTELGFFITEPNSGDYLIQLVEGHHYSTDEVINQIRTRVEQQVPALQVEFGQVINDMLGDLMSSKEPIELKVFGDDPVRLQELARQIAKQVEHVRGTADVFNGIVIAGPSISVDPKESELHFYDLTAHELWSQLKLKIQGLDVGGVLEKQQVVPIRMISDDHIRKNINQIKNTSIILPDGKRKQLDQVATVHVKRGSAEINRENLQAMIPVTARLENRDLGSAVAAIKKAISQNISLPHGYRIAYGGAYSEQQQSFQELLLVLLSASLLVFLVILFLFREIGASLVIFFTSILGISGSVLMLYITGTPLNVGSYTGIIMIVGIIAENAIFTYYQFHQALEEDEMNVTDAINYAISLRLRPKLMTATAAITALLPLALAIGVGAQLHQPLAIAVIGGLLVALPLLLIVLPTLIHLLFKATGNLRGSA
jgi:CzcA family heavy metal efflux pump